MRTTTVTSLLIMISTMIPSKVQSFQPVPTLGFLPQQQQHQSCALAMNISTKPTPATTRRITKLATECQQTKTTTTTNTQCKIRSPRKTQNSNQARRNFLSHASFFSGMLVFLNSSPAAFAAEDATAVQVVLSGELKQLFTEGRAKEMQGNMPAAQRIYTKVTKLAPRFIYGWSNLGNTQVALGALDAAEDSYSKSVALCVENLKQVQQGSGNGRRCGDLYLLLLNRGSVRLNNGMKEKALKDLEDAATLRGRPDAILLQNRARARELNGQYPGADADYDVAISMTNNEVAPFWLRSALVKFQLGETIAALDVLRRVEVRFPEAPELRAALAAMLMAKGDEDGARKKFLEMPELQQGKFREEGYLRETIAWPPKMIESLMALIKAIDNSR